MPFPAEAQVRTRITLLARLTQGDPDGWAEFCTLYRPLIRRITHRLQLSPAESQDAEQEVLLAVWRNLARYDPHHGRFRTWLSRLAGWRARDQLKRRPPRTCIPCEQYGQPGQTPWLENLADSRRSELERLWDEEWHSWILDRAFEHLKHRHHVRTRWLQAYDLCVRQQLPVDRVAEFLGTTPRNVMTMRSRITRELHDEIDRLEHRNPAPFTTRSAPSITMPT
jgi:RNA polymerase sigma-70 factor (ECF subfamily)